MPRSGTRLGRGPPSVYCKSETTIQLMSLRTNNFDLCLRPAYSHANDVAPVRGPTKESIDSSKRASHLAHRAWPREAPMKGIRLLAVGLVIAVMVPLSLR